MADEAPASDRQSKRLTRGRLLGRRTGQVVYYAAVVAFAISATWQISKQIFYPSAPAAPATTTSCPEGLRALLKGIEHAKHAADRDDGDVTEEAALDRFRAALGPSWAHREAVGGVCTAPEHKRLLDAIDRLRYSEEHGVRKQAAELTALRRKVSRMAAEVLQEETP